ncbi:iron-containing alcohol dehydrogenase [Dactylosporangium vinaceum]|uniref:Maleylacetate reductase and hydroxyquinol 1,2-dioxygenase domain-containing protein n=1 Tax=Dactylosporangium vinaceum TaxID=53362 RepID=A0ABV5MSH6_9ACTN|nr:maleylacetate reductase and hydroxyquinol 1,2-dioxygenase domain-containing protein [Dactylosporangium vinaceum]UAC00905.1 iron-containing alcohol dehydrogenase [Dactylosporangium vinaceum]
MSFVYTAGAARVVFGSGTRQQLADEVRRLGRSRVMVVATPSMRDAAALGAMQVARFDGVAMHTPVAVTHDALGVLRASAADCIVSIGGGSATGLGKALAVRTGLPHIAVPTTYAGSEVTPVLGETDGGEKTTRSDPRIQPATVVYDVELTAGLPVALSVTSGVNAIAHAVEALYSPDANPVTDDLAAQAIRRLAGALPRIVADPADLAARTDALTGAWLAGICLGTAGMGLHHKLCHALGGSFGLPHAEVHTVVLPHAMAFNAAASPGAMRRVADALGARDAPTAMFDLIARLGGPVSLRDLGLAAADIPAVARAATSRQYPNPRPVTAPDVETLLRAAFTGERPAGPPPTPDLRWLTEQVVASFGGAPDPRARQLVTDLVRRLHEFVTDNDLTPGEWQFGIDFLTRTGQLCSDVRQEFVLLSDTLGVSSMVDVLSNSRTPDTTPSAVLGPFYVPGPPVQPPGADIAAGLPGTPLWTDVAIVDVDGKPVAGAVVDVWQSNDDGFYDVQLPDQDGPVLRARFHSDAEGRVRFWSILPSEYPIPDDGPVGQMLAATGRHQYRAPHLHFMISADGYRRLITQLFVAGGAYLDSDTVFGVKRELVVDFVPGRGAPPDGRDVAGWRAVTYTFRIAAA